MTATQPTVFADLRSRINSGPNEAGLLGIAFSPTFATDGRVYVSYTAPSSMSPVNLRSRLSRLRSTDGGLTAAPATEEILFAVDQPFENHNGGHIAFGPDGFLYFGLGDGGSGGDPGNRAQNKTLPFGKLLRFDVSGATGYAIPSTNPFATGGGLREIYAWGLRNPWRFSFDAATQRLWLGDVGQDAFEEIDLIELGGNYGWRIREGNHCFNPATGCTSTGLKAPVAEYGRTEGISVTGGFAYRGTAIPALLGQYLFADFGSGRMWALADNGNGSFTRRLVHDTTLNIASFAQASTGELFVVDLMGGGISKIIAEPCEDPTEMPDAGVTLDASTPDAPSTVTLRDVYSTVIAPRCAPCHTTGMSGGLAMPNAQAAFGALVNHASTSTACGTTLVVPGSLSSSVLWTRLTGTSPCGPVMPLFAAPLSASHLELVRVWITGGAVF